MKTVGFFLVLQPSPEPKLTMPRTSQEPFSAWQFSGPPESPCARQSRCHHQASPTGRLREQGQVRLGGVG